jgi:hypothetical protein
MYVDLRLHQVLEQLYTALKAWEASVKASTYLTGAFLPDRGYRQEERAVNAASIAFEEFHAKLGHAVAIGRNYAAKDVGGLWRTGDATA